MQLISFEQHSSFNEELDRLVETGSLNPEQAEKLRRAPRWYISLREILSYLGAIFILVGVVRIVAAVLQDASPMSIAALLYLAGGAVLATALFFHHKSGALKRVGEVLELVGLGLEAVAVGITLNESDFRGEHIAVILGAAGLAWGIFRCRVAQFAGTIVLCTGWIAVCASSISLLNPDERVSALLFILVGLALLVFSHTHPNFEFAPRTVGAFAMMIAAQNIRTGESAWWSVIPLVICALVFLYSAISLRAELLIVSTVMTTVSMGIFTARALENDIASGLLMTTTGVALVFLSVMLLKDRKSQSGLQTTH